MTCKFCNYEICDKHHIIPQEFGGSNIEENICDLCPNHHRCFHLLMRFQKLTRDPHRSKTNSRARKLSQQVFFIFTYEKELSSWFLDLSPVLKNCFLTDSEIFQKYEEKHTQCN